MFKKLGLISVLATSLLCGNAWAVGTGNNAITAQFPTRQATQFVQGTDSAGTYKTVYTGETINGAASIIKSLIVTSTDGSLAHLVTCNITNGSNSYELMAVNVPLNSGFGSGAPAVNLLAPVNMPGLPVDNDGNPYLNLISGDTLKCTFATALTASSHLNVNVVVGGDY